MFGSNSKPLFVRVCKGRGGMIDRFVDYLNLPLFSATSGVDDAVCLAQLSERMRSSNRGESAM